MYQVTVSEEQLLVIKAALDMYSRVGLGQLDSLFDHPDMYKRLWTKGLKEQDLQAHLDIVKREVFDFPPNASYGIFSNEIHSSNRVAWDLQQVLRHRLAWDLAGNPETRDYKTMMGVSYDEPMQSSHLQLAKIEKV